MELASLDSKYTSIDKLWCLRATLRSVQVEVDEHCHETGVNLDYGDGKRKLHVE